MTKENDKKYYNPELKQRYLYNKEKVLGTPNNYIETQFRKTAKYEYEMNKDVSEWNVYEILEYYKLLNTTSAFTLINIHSILSQYTQYCFENNLLKDNQNHYLECDQIMLYSCVNKTATDKKIITREDILSWVEELPNPRDQFIILGLFEFGKSKDFKDLTYARLEDVQGRIMTLGHRKVQISDELYAVIQRCKEEKKYYSMTGQGKRIVDLVDSGYILKNYPNISQEISDFQKGRNIYMACKRIFVYLSVDEWMTPADLAESGKINMVIERSKELGLTPSEYLEHHYKELENQYNFKFVSHVFFKKYRKYLE